ncbi:hypothetical protein BZG02_09665 [Labilibaculum filiforme]|uniref:Uncharacterized protein n=1 Tax=Labilibaculum filiforme TaxID=1940526 RepID=A0A2N3HY92_9BACT|nr:hypothetical protein [Labilibaculum filiforme]PKQ63029.1 hypothetical protein BZG02_09665 [Labilibaculum filiforme]
MNKLGKILILAFLIISCKNTTEQSIKNDTSISTTSEEVVNQKDTSKINEINVDDFLKYVIRIIVEGDQNEIESVLFFPFEGYTVGGEEISYSDFESFIFSSEVYESFINLKYAINIESDKVKEMYWIDIKMPNGYEFSNTYRIIKVEEEFKFAGMQLPF